MLILSTPLSQLSTALIPLKLLAFHVIAGYNYSSRKSQGLPPIGFATSALNTSQVGVLALTCSLFLHLLWQG
jgi:hypothetical protein